MSNFNIDFLDLSFSNIKKSMQETSFDKDNGIFMTQSQKEVISFDDVAEQYSLRMGQSNTVLSSVDSLFFIGQEIFLVEFKNGCLISEKIKKNKRELIRLKIQKKFYETMLVLMELRNDFSFDYFRQNATLILVYNEDKNSEKNKIHRQMSKKAKQEQSIQKLNLAYMKDYCCKDFRTYTEQEFETFLKANNLF